jgi:hypothetical protein
MPIVSIRRREETKEVVITYPGLAIDRALADIAGRYGERTAAFVALTVGGQPFIVTQEPGVTSGALADIYIDEVDVTFPGGDGPIGAVTNEGVDGSLGIKYTGLAQWSATSRLHLPAAADISAVLATDRLQNSLDLSEGGPATNTIHIYFDDDWQSEAIALGIDAAPGFQTFTIDIGAIRERLGDEVNDIYFKAGNGFPANGTLKVDNIKFIGP